MTAPGDARPYPRPVARVTVLAACTVIAAACGHTTGTAGQPHAQAVVPWLDSPATTATTTSPTLPPAKAPLCQAGQLQGSAGRAGAATGNIGQDIDLTNTSDTTCQLSGWPTAVAGVRPNGTHVVLGAHHGTFFGDLLPIDVRPGQQGQVILGTSDGCGALNGPSQAVIQANQANNTYASVILGMPGGGTVSVQGVNTMLACGLDVSEFGSRPPAGPEAPLPTPGSMQSLSARLVLPGPVAPGHTYDYEVVLTNPNSATVKLGPCPAYTEYLNGQTATYLLNCDAQPSIPGGAAVTFAMEVSVPSGLPAGAAKLAWTMDIPGGAFVGHVVQAQAQ